MDKHSTTSGFAHGKVDPREAGAKGGRAPKTSRLARRLADGIVASGNGAAKLGLKRDIERSQPQPAATVETPDYDKVIRAFTPHMLADFLRLADRETLYEAIGMLAREEETDATA
jgi:hypothetical protein